jgi:gas vesicle protein
MNHENQESIYSTTNNNILSALGGLLIGSLAGALTMLLLAPQSGQKTRLQIQEKSIELRDQASGMLEDALGQARLDGNKLSRQGRQKAKELLHHGQVLVVEQIEHVSEAVKAGKKAIQIS